MNPYMNSYNYGYQQPNPYMQRMENLQQFQQVVNQPVIPMQNQQMLVVGKMVESEDIVRVTDIPMDGNVYYFPKADGTEIYSKQFMPNGQTRILTFKPVLENNPSVLPNEEEKSLYEGFNSVLVGIQEDVKALNEKIDKISKPTRSKKEVSEDE
jgi:hypothetical protein